MRAACLPATAAALSWIASAAVAADGIATAPWKLESVELADGRRLEGIFEDDDAAGDGVGFTEVVRPPGREMYLIHRAHLGRDRITSQTRLPKAEHDALAAKIREFRGRGRTRSRAESAVRLVRNDAGTGWTYEGAWFTLESSAPDGLTRESIVRLEQLFVAFDNLLPVAPKKQPGGAPRPPRPRLTVRLCGTEAEYRRLQASIRGAATAAVANPAFYDGRQRLLAAGSDIPILAEEFETAAESLAAAELAQRKSEHEIEDLLRDMALLLERQGVPSGQRGEIIRRARLRHERERADAAERIATTRRDNQQRIVNAKSVFFRRLAHEAWHAHAHRLTDSLGGRPLPPWLDEGLAQVFETAALEVGELRIDAPDPDRLQALQELLRRPQRRPLSDWLAMGPETFLVGHADDSRTSRDAYLHAWGLALHVAMLEPVLDNAALVRLAASTDQEGRVAPFERLVGMPIDRFEPLWIGRLLAIKPPRR